MASSTSIAFLVLALVLAFLYSPTTSNSVLTATLHPLRVLLLTAHPDDECLFFAPTVLALADHQLFSLCLSVGNADGMGSVRESELSRSLDILGIAPDKRWIVDHPELQDNITAEWDPVVIASTVEPYIVENKITHILTFDYEGISSHPNHKALPTGVMRLLGTEFQSSATPAPRLFTLISVPVVTKYSSILSPVMAKIDLHVQKTVYIVENIMTRVLRVFGLLADPKPGEQEWDRLGPAMPVFVSGLPQYWQALQAMRAHSSQLVWFRWLYVVFSRYMWLNEWVEVKI